MTTERWQKMTIFEQLGNIGSEFSRALILRQKNDLQRSQKSFEEVLHLLDLTISDRRLFGRRKELTRLREIIKDQMIGAGVFAIESDSLNQYFLDFAVSARAKRA